MTQPLTPAARRSRALLLWFLVIAFVAIPIIEIWLLVTVGGWIGLWPTLGLLVISGLVGAWLTRREGTRAWQALVDAFGGGRLPTGRLADAALVLIGGLMLMLPGFFSDILGLIMLLPFTRPLVRRLLAFVLARNQARTPSGRIVIKGETVTAPSSSPTTPVVIRGEVEDGS
ncbi:MAG: FxsA family protein [Propionicimonas sp.]|nr:FxsA family protein [Propionicimonas sp.]